MVFECVKKTKKAKCWNFFHYEKSTERAECQLCKQILRCPGSTTKGLNDHMKAKHLNDWAKIVDDTPKKVDKTPQSKINSYTTKPVKRSREEVITRLALDNIPFSTIAKSEMMREHFELAGVPLPKSHTTVRKMVVDHANLKKNEMIERLAIMKEAGSRFSISLDEYTSTRNRKYLNINLHSKTKLFCLGLVRVKGSLPAEALDELVKNHLEKFKIDMFNDLVSSTSDGAAIMVKWGRSIPCEHLLCVLHGINLAIIDVLYTKDDDDDLFNEDDDEDDDSDDDDDDEDDQLFGDDDVIEGQELPTLRSDKKKMVKAVRRQVRYYRFSSVGNYHLQTLIKAKNGGKEIQLIRDVKTRWNSLYQMIKRFLSVWKEVKQANHQLGRHWPEILTDANINELKHLSNALEVVEAAVKGLSSNSMTLYLAENVYQFTTNKLLALGTDIAKEINTAFRRRVGDRRNVTLIHLALYLREPSFINKSKDNFGEKIVKKQVYALAADLVSRLYPSVEANVDDQSSDDQMNVDDSTQMLSYSEELQKVLEKASSEEKPVEKQFATLKEELSWFEKNPNPMTRPPTLQKLLYALGTIQVASVEAERIFSICGSFVTKVRSRLEDDTIDALVYLKKYYIRQKDEDISALF